MLASENALKRKGWKLTAFVSIEVLAEEGILSYFTTYYLCSFNSLLLTLGEILSLVNW